MTGAKNLVPCLKCITAAPIVPVAPMTKIFMGPSPAYGRMANGLFRMTYLDPILVDL
jgi:hypothetical protein